MIVVGGIYQERCRFPHWDRIFGSGLRAAVALSGITTSVDLRAYVPDELAPDVIATLNSFGITHHLHRSHVAITFPYLHPFEKQLHIPTEFPQEDPIFVEGDAILRFGLMEGDAVVSARRAVYDPQCPYPKSFTANGSRADEHVLVGNAPEILALAGVEPKVEVAGAQLTEMTVRDAAERLGRPDVSALRDAVALLLDVDETLRAVLVKDYLGGVTVYDGDEGFPIRTYAAESYFRIGAGDIIAAGFSYAWAEKRQSIREAADFAARCVAFAMEGPRLPLESAGVGNVTPSPSPPLNKLRIVGGDTLELQVLARDAQNWIKWLGGEATIEQEVNEPHVVLILVGAMNTPEPLERLIAIARSGPAVVYWPHGQRAEVSALFGDVVHARDFASALYRAMRMTFS